jgi:ribonuclease P protein component
MDARSSTDAEKLAEGNSPLHKFPKSVRLLKNFQYKQLHRFGQRLSGPTFCVQLQKRGIAPAKLGITVAKKWGKSHERNRFKRVIREAFREMHPTLPNGLEINVSPHKKIETPSKGSVLLELKDVLKTHVSTSQP